jgi:hypothetical protein
MVAAAGELTTKADHNGTRHGPIPADVLVVQHQVTVSDSPAVLCKQGIIDPAGLILALQQRSTPQVIAHH